MLSYDIGMKKIKVSDLAKKKKIPATQAVKMLKDKGLAKVTASTLVLPDALEEANSVEKKESAVISHIFPPISTSGSLASQALRINEMKKESNPGKSVKTEAKTKKGAPKKEAASAPSAEKKALQPPSGGKPKIRADIFAAIAAVIAIILLGLMYVGQKADRAVMKELGASLSEIKETVAGLENGLAENRNAIEVVDKKIEAVDLAVLSLEVRSQGAVLKSLSGNLKESLRVRTQTLADGLASF